MANYPTRDEIGNAYVFISDQLVELAEAVRWHAQGGLISEATHLEVLERIATLRGLWRDLYDAEMSGNPDLVAAVLATIEEPTPALSRQRRSLRPTNGRRRQASDHRP